MLTLYGFTAAFELYDLSPFVTKVATWLRMNGIAYEGKTGDPRASPKGKLPYIDHDGRVLSDSSFILAYCKKAFGVDPDAGMTERERATATMLQSLFEEHLYFAVLYLRWKDPRGWKVMRPVLERFVAGVGVPGPLRGAVAGFIRRGSIKRLAGQGMGKHTPEEVEQIACGLLDAAAGALGESAYLLGDAPRSIDATAWAFLQGLRKFPVENRARAHLLANDRLVAYCERIEKRYWAKS